MSFLTVAEALSRVTAGLTPLDAEHVPLEDAHGRILAADLAAKLTQPPFHASAMDGYALRAQDIASCPVTLHVIGEAAAGHEFTQPVAPGQAVRIFTGAPLPEGTDTIVIQENTRPDGDTVVIEEGAEKGNFVRTRGLDFTEGDTLLTKGQKLAPRHLTLAAAMNHATLPLTKKPRIAVIATGDELVEPGETPAHDQIISSIPYGLCAMIEAAGAQATRIGIARDNEQSLMEAMARAQDGDIMLTIGGASEGDHDLVQQALKAKGMTLDFWKVAMRPGKPLMFGTLNGQRVLGVPGNPVSALICARIFLVPMINRLLGKRDADFEEITAQLAAPLSANGPRQHYMRAKLTKDRYGDLHVTAIESQDSALQAALARANCLIIRPPNAGALTIGEAVPVLPLDF